MFCCIVILLAIITAVLLLGTIIGWENVGEHLSRLLAIGEIDYAHLRLPEHIKPLMYDLSIKPYLSSYADVPPEKELTFDGEVAIVMEVLAPITQIVLHMAEIKLIAEECKVTLNGRRIPIHSISTSKKMEVVVFRLGETIGEREHLKLELTYTGIIGTHRLNGLYQTTYTDKQGKQKIAAVTQFEPTKARLMVPCFDEPAFKAAWTVTVIHPEGTVALSNGMESSSEKVTDGPWIVSKFQRTPRMSTYLLAIAIGEFEFLEGYTKTNVRFRTWSRPEAVNMTSYACKCGLACLEFYEDFFDIKYPMPKQDMLALPDFAAGAMENWGLITYRESSLLYDANIYPPKLKYNVAATVAHELAHQWFGNLVTMMWWDDLWLNEGFATYMEHISLDTITKGVMRLKDFFLLDTLERALHADSVASSHPLSFKIERSVEIHEAFSPISYDKGASLLAMISSIMGEKNFNTGIKHYLNKFSYDNARSSDLWEALDSVTIPTFGSKEGHFSVKQFADQWTTQMGFPLVTVSAVNSSYFEITQSRYKKDPSAQEVEKYRFPKYGFKWQVPIFYQMDDEEVKFTWLPRDRPLYIPANTERTTLVVNAERHGYYRQNYDEQGWKKIIRQLEEDHKIYSSRTRNAIISDAFAAAVVDQVSYKTVLNLIDYMKQEKDYIPWSVALTGLDYIGSHFQHEQDLAFFKSYMRKLLKPVYKARFFRDVAENYKNNDYFQESNFKMSIIGSYCEADADECTAKYVNFFEEEVLSKCGNGLQASSCVKIPAPHRSGAYCYGVKKLGDTAYDKVMKLYKLETVQVEKKRLLHALGCHQDVAVLQSILELAMDRNEFRLQDVPSAFYAVADNRLAGELVFNFLFENWDRIYESFHHDHTILSRVIGECLSRGYTEAHFQKVELFIAKHKEAAQLNKFRESMELLRVRVEWIRKHFSRVLEYFRSYN